MKGNIFKRVEQKYILSNDEYDKIQELIKEHFEKDVYYKSKIYNIYFDNDNNDLIIKSLERPIFKIKIRIRSYGVPEEDDIIYFEIKEKYKGTVYKRRVSLTLREYNSYISKGIFPENNRQIMKEIDYYINYYKIHPNVFVAYDRLSYYCKEDINFRITFDNNIRSRFDNLKLADDENDRQYFEDNKYVMEVKALDSLPCWFVKYLSDNKIYPVSLSKVGRIYMKERDGKKC